MREAATAPVNQNFNPEFMQHGYDQNFVHAAEGTGPGLTSPISTWDNELLDGLQSKAPGEERLGSSENTGRPITKQE